MINTFLFLNLLNNEEFKTKPERKKYNKNTKENTWLQDSYILHEVVEN